VKLTFEELRALYARGTSAGSDEHPAADLLARLLSKEVSDGERAKAVDHIATCARCAEEARVARPIGDALSKAEGTVVRPWVWWRPALLLAAAAGVANGWIGIARTSGTAPWIGYGVVNDGGAPGQRTGDGAYVPMER
jgi:hypothetical protein